MKYRKLGTKGPVVSTVGFGAWGISGRDWGNTDDDKSRKAILAALEAGAAGTRKKKDVKKKEKKKEQKKETKKTQKKEQET